MRTRRAGSSVRIGRVVSLLAGFLALILGTLVGIKWVLGDPVPIGPIVALWISMVIGGAVAAFLWRSRVGALPAGAFITAFVGVAVMFGTGVLIRWLETSEVPHLDRATWGTFVVLAVFAGGVAQAVKGKL